MLFVMLLYVICFNFHCQSKEEVAEFFSMFLQVYYRFAESRVLHFLRYAREFLFVLTVAVFVLRPFYCFPKHFAKEIALNTSELANTDTFTVMLINVCCSHK